MDGATSSLLLVVVVEEGGEEDWTMAARESDEESAFLTWALVLCVKFQREHFEHQNQYLSCLRSKSSATMKTTMKVLIL